MVRELGPVLAATMLAGRVGSAMAAELATMRVTEQIDALACLGVDPVHYLVVPRFLACVLLIPLLTVMADFMGVVGGALICLQRLRHRAHHYWRHADNFVGPWDVFVGLVKSVVFGGGRGPDRAATAGFIVMMASRLVTNRKLVLLALVAGALTVFRAEALPASVDLNEVSANVTITGADPDDNLGSSAAAGDINDDGIQDLIVGAKAQFSSLHSGRVYIFYGGPNLPSTLDLGTATADVTVLGDDAPGSQHHVGWSLAVGDLNDDDVDDLIMGAPATHSDVDPGRVYVLYGGASLPSVIDLTSESVDVTILGDAPGDDTAGRSRQATLTTTR